MDFFKRIGTNRHKFKVQFFLNKLTSNAKLKGDVYVTIRRGNKWFIKRGSQTNNIGKKEFWE